jgi:hypothetical protein
LSPSENSGVAEVDSQSAAGALEAQTLLRTIEIEDRRLQRMACGAASDSDTDNACATTSTTFHTGTIFDREVFEKVSRQATMHRNGDVSVSACAAIDDADERVAVLQQVIDAVQREPALLPTANWLSVLELLKRHRRALSRAQSDDDGARRGAVVELSALAPLPLMQTSCLFVDSTRVKLGSFVAICLRSTLRSLRMAVKQHCWNSQATSWPPSVLTPIRLARVVRISVVQRVAFVHVHIYRPFRLLTSADPSIAQYPARNLVKPFAVAWYGDGSDAVEEVFALSQSTSADADNGGGTI